MDGAGGLEIAPLGRRVLAQVIDAAAFLIPGLLVGAGVAGLYHLYRRRRPAGDEASDPFDMPRLRLVRSVGESTAWRLGFGAAMLPVEVAIRNWRTPGDRAMGLRRVDARTGGPVSVQSTLIRVAVQAASRELSRRVQRPLQERSLERTRGLQAALKEAREIRAGDPEAQQRAMTEVLKRSPVRPTSSCSRGVLGGMLGSLPLQLPALWSERNQTLPERIAGIVTVRD
jgi:RDD family